MVRGNRRPNDARSSFVQASAARITWPAWNVPPPAVSISITPPRSRRAVTGVRSSNVAPCIWPDRPSPRNLWSMYNPANPDALSLAGCVAL